MNISKFFQRVVHIYEPPLLSIKTSLKQLEKFGVKVDVYQPQAPQSLLMPRTSAFTAHDLSQLLAFYTLIAKAQSDSISNLLIVGPKVNINKDADDKFDQITDSLPYSWDLVYLGYRDASYQDKPTDEKQLYKVNYASGLQAIGINNRFYHLFLEAARVPTAPLDGHIKSLSLASNIFVINPPLVIPS